MKITIDRDEALQMIKEALEAKGYKVGNVEAVIGRLFDDDLYLERFTAELLPKDDASDEPGA